MLSNLYFSSITRVLCVLSMSIFFVESGKKIDKLSINDTSRIQAGYKQDTSRIQVECK